MIGIVAAVQVFRHHGIYADCRHCGHNFAHPPPPGTCSCISDGVPNCPECGCPAQMPMNFLAGHEPYVIVVKGDEDGPGRVLAKLPAANPTSAVSLFREKREVPELPRGHRIDAVPARVIAEADIGRSWEEGPPGTYLYAQDVTTHKIESYVPVGRVDARGHG